MIPILYEKSEKNFSYNGIGFLTEAIKCVVTEERNGIFELSLQYPVTGKLYSYIDDGTIVKAKANDTSDPQLFRIYKSSKPINGIVTYAAEHISYELNGIPCMGLDVKNVTAQIAMTNAFDHASFMHKFTAISDINTPNSTAIKTPCSLRAILGGQRGSILDVWGGEFEFDNFTVKLHKSRGQNHGVTIEYGKNLTDLTQESNISECYTHLCPYAKKQVQDANGDYQDVYLHLTEEVIDLPTAVTIGRNKALVKDFSNEFYDGEEFTEEALRTKANAYIQKANLGVPKVNISVSFVQLWQTEEYKNIAPLERVRLCDAVTVRFAKLGVNATAKVIKTEYNSILEKYEKITLGDAKSTFADTLDKQDEAIKDVSDKVDKEKDFIAERDKAQSELNETIANSMGLFTTRVTQSNGSITVYYHNVSTLESSTYIYTRNAGGFAWTDTGWNNGNPVWKYGVSKDGNAIMNTIVANKLWAELIVAGRLQSKDGSSFFDLDNGQAQLFGSFTAKATSDIAGFGTSATLRGFNAVTDSDGNLVSGGTAGLAMHDSNGKEYGNFGGIAFGTFKQLSMIAYNDAGDDAVAQISVSKAGSAFAADKTGTGNIYHVGNLKIESGIAMVYPTADGNLYKGSVNIDVPGFSNAAVPVVTANTGNAYGCIASCSKVSSGSFTIYLARNDSATGTSVSWMVTEVLI